MDRAGEPPVERQEESEKHICCSTTGVGLELIRREGGEEAVAEMLRLAAVGHDAAYLENVDNWVSLDEASAVLEAGVRMSGDPNFARRVGQETLRQHSGTQVATLLRSLGSVEAVLEMIAQSTPKVSTVTEMHAVEVQPGRAILTAHALDGYSRDRLHCDWTTGLLTGFPILFGLPLAHVEESECQAEGAEQCLYTVTWDAQLAETAVDPQQRVTALEAQLLAMSERLHSVYAIAGDLVSTEDVETVLHRIVERAGEAVRAPSHILAVRPDEDAELQVYSHGISDSSASTLAQAAIAGESSPGESTLAVEVASSRRSYGQLIARYPGTLEFMPQEKELLGLYAKHAAAVLDIALALQESDHRHEQVSALLALSHALAEAGTSLEVAERLAAAVPEVVDCDRIGVWLWDSDARCLQSLAVWGRTPEQGTDLGVSIAPEDTPNLRSMLADPQPHFYREGTDDQFVGQLMNMLEVVALTVVPIIAHGVFVGLLTVSVAEHPERLRADSDLLERLTGVAALAAPAIQNGQLVDQLRHKASHDGLTGLLNRVGFKARIDSVLQGARDEDGQVGLLFVDLNEFKRVNDLHGHEAGDELIRQSALRLDATCRGEDAVARLGGDEFAIILADVHRDEQVRAAERRVKAAFAEPFNLGELSLTVGASVGGGIWPEDGRTVSELVKHADAAMYVDKAHSRRSQTPGRPHAPTFTVPSRH